MRLVTGHARNASRKKGNYIYIYVYTYAILYTHNFIIEKEFSTVA